MTDTWRWPIVGGSQALSVVGGEVQDSAAHALRGVGPSCDLPGRLGDSLVALAPFERVDWFYDAAAAGHYCEFTWQGSRGAWRARYCHQDGARSWRVGMTGNATGPHLHLVLWLDGARVKPEEQAEFVALLSQLSAINEQDHAIEPHDGAINPQHADGPEVGMTDAEKATLNDVAGQLETFARARTLQANAVKEVGAGESWQFSDPLAEREAIELGVQAGRLRELAR